MPTQRPALYRHIAAAAAIVVAAEASSRRKRRRGGSGYRLRSKFMMMVVQLNNVPGPTYEFSYVPGSCLPLVHIPTLLALRSHRDIVTMAALELRALPVEELSHLVADPPPAETALVASAIAGEGSRDDDDDGDDDDDDDDAAAAAPANPSTEKGSNVKVVVAVSGRTQRGKKKKKGKGDKKGKKPAAKEVDALASIEQDGAIDKDTLAKR
jgi:hypothetical protein